MRIEAKDDKVLCPEKFAVTGLDACKDCHLHESYAEAGLDEHGAAEPPYVTCNSPHPRDAAEGVALDGLAKAFYGDGPRITEPKKIDPVIADGGCVEHSEKPLDEETARRNAVHIHYLDHDSPDN